MRDFKTLLLLDRCQGMFKRSGIHYDDMRRILQIKLLMDGRRVPTLLGKSSNKVDTEEYSNHFIKSLWIYVVMGVVMVPFVVMGQSYMFQMSLLFGILMFMITTSLISDFSSVLLDVRDRNILFSKPVDHRTINVAKAIHIMIYLLFITGSLTAAPLIAGLIRHGILFFLLFVVEIILMDLFVVVLTAVLYWLVLRFFDGEKLKDIINYVQIGLTIAMTVGYQLISRMFNMMDFKFVFEPKWWQFFIFPVWFAAPFEWLFGEHRSFYIIAFTILSVLIPLIAIRFYVSLMPSFEKNLHKLTNQSGRTKKAAIRWSDAIGRLICRSREEDLFFRFASDMMKKERDFKLKVYPSLGFSLIFPFIFLFNGLGPGGGLEGMRSSKAYLFIYFCALMIPTVVMMLKFSGTYKGAWIYSVVPMRDTTPMYRGTLKACLVRLLLPIFMLQSIIFIVIFGIRILPDLLVIFIGILLYTIISFKMLSKGLPFSEPFQAAQQGSGFIIFFLLILLGLFAGLHLASTFIAYGVYLLLAVLLIANFAAWKLAFRKV